MGNFASGAVQLIRQATPYIALGSSAFGAYQSYVAGRAANTQAGIEAKQVEDNTRADEIERKRALLSAISAQNAIAGAGGITTGGSFGAMQKADIRDAQNDLLRSKASGAAKMRALRARGRALKQQGEVGAVTGLFQGLSDFGKAYVPRKQSTSTSGGQSGYGG